MKRVLYPVVFAMGMLVLSVAIAAAQTTPPPGAPGAGSLAPRAMPSPPVEKLVDGPVKKVDPASNTMQVGWFFGMLNTTLAVNSDTHIAVEGVKGSLTDIREGDEVKASYEVRDGKNIAKSIEATHGEPKGGAASPGAKAGTAPMQAPGGANTPPSGRPKSE